MTANEAEYIDRAATNLSYGLRERDETSGYPPKMTDHLQLIGKGLSHQQNILLMTDGTVTELLEYLSGEPIQIEKLREEIVSDRGDLPPLHRDQVEEHDFPFLIRRILLKGAKTKRNYIYAESSILLDNLPKGFRDDLVNSKLPIGKLWSKHRLETYKTAFAVKHEEADRRLAGFLSIPVGSCVLSRTYSVYTYGRKSMLITEKFASSCFSEKS